MSESVITLLLFGAALAGGGIAHHRVATYGANMPRLIGIAMRLLFGICVFMALWSCTAYAFWLAGVQLKIGTINRGIMGDQWWLGPLWLIWAALTRYELRRESHTDGNNE